MKKGLQRSATSLVLILFVAFAARVAFAYHQASQISPQVLGVIPFQTETGHIAYSLATGKGFSSPFQKDTGPTAWLAPAYPVLLAGIFKLFGVYSLQSFYVAVFSNILFSTATCAPIYYAGRRVAGLAAACTAAWFWALFPNAILLPFEWIWDTSVSALLAAMLVWMTIEVSESARLRDWCMYGALWGIAALTNPALTLPFPLLFGWAVLRCGRLNKRKLMQPLLSLAIAALCCLPWTIRNYVRFHALIPMRSNFAFELYVGNNENYADENRFRPGAVTQDREILRYFRMGETAFMEAEQRKALAFILAHPRTEIRLIGLRSVDFWMGSSTPLATFREAHLLLLRFVLFCNYLAPIGTLMGAIVLILRKNAFRFPLVSFAAVYPVLYYVTHTSLRYRHPIDPVIMLLTAAGIIETARWLTLSRQAAALHDERSTPP
jgi:4-amino-4-deoxy-L-arabinose transferase-like glycosyltransferase